MRLLPDVRQWLLVWYQTRSPFAFSHSAAHDEFVCCLSCSSDRCNQYKADGSSPNCSSQFKANAAARWDTDCTPGSVFGRLVFVFVFFRCRSRCSDVDNQGADSDAHGSPSGQPHGSAIKGTHDGHKSDDPDGDRAPN
jgi:hypothetical protein